MTFDLPRETIFPVDHVDVRLATGPHPFLAGREREVAASWRREKAANPALFDGEVVLLSRLAYRDGLLEGLCHVVRYSQFLYWRNRHRAESAEHAYAHAVLVASDNALVAIRMAPHTVNAGQVYFAAGSFEPGDFPAGRVDLHGNMRREVMEETGVDLAFCDAEPVMHALSLTTGTVLFRRYFDPRPASTIAEAIRHHIANGGDDEIEDVVIIRHHDPMPDLAASHMPALVEWHFATARMSEG